MTDGTVPAPVGTRARIIEAALRLMAEHGIAGVSMKAIADTAGVARQTLYNHFPDVESIVAEAVEAHQIESLDSLRTALATMESPMARLEYLIRQSAAAAVQHHPTVALRHGLSAATKGALSEHDDELLAIIQATLAAGVVTGEFRADLDVHRDALLVRSMLDAVEVMVSADPDHQHAIVAGSTHTLLAAVAAPETGTS